MRGDAKSGYIGGGNACMAAALVSPRATAHKRASLRAAALGRLEDESASPRSAVSPGVPEPNETPVLLKGRTSAPAEVLTPRTCGSHFIGREHR